MCMIAARFVAHSPHDVVLFVQHRVDARAVGPGTVELVGTREALLGAMLGLGMGRLEAEEILGAAVNHCSEQA